jgi:hypothetical protein
MSSRATTWIALARWVLAAVLGYAVIVLLTTLGLEVWLEGAPLWGAEPAILVQGVAVSVVAGLAGGWLAAWVGGRRPLLHAASVLLFLALDGGYVLFVLPLRAPWWFELGGLLTLMAATLAGGSLAAWRSTKTGARTDLPR